MQKKINILYISELLDMGGGERNLLSIVEKLDKHKFQPLVLCPRSGPLVRELEKRNIKFFIQPFGIAKKFLGFFPIVSLITIIRFGKLMFREKIGLVHANCFSGVVFASIPAKLMGIPLVWSVHGWTSGAGVQGLLINFFVERILVVSNAVRRFLCQSGLILDDKVRTIFLGVDFKVFQDTQKSDIIRQEFAINKDIPLIGMIGRLQAVKGHYYFLQAAQEIKKEFPQAKFLLVGARLFNRKSDEGYPQEIAKWIKEMGLEKDCICTGFRNDIPEILSALNMLVLPSLSESFGLILVEAMAAGVPVIATYSGGPEDIVEPGICGLLVAPKDSSALSKAALSILKNPEKAREMVSSAKKRAQEIFSLDTQVNKIEAVYNQLIHLKVKE